MKIAMRNWLLVFIIFGLSVPGFAQKQILNTLDQRLDQAPAFQQNHTGFALYDPEKREFLYQRNGDRYFTPASNTKLFTFYISLSVLGDTLPTLFYAESDTAVVFWGSGDPSFLNPFLPEDSSVVNFLEKQEKPLYFSGFNFRDERYGAGWSWDDYSYTYQLEKSPMPVFGNRVYFARNKKKQGFRVEPAFFTNNVSLNKELPEGRPIFRRAEGTNDFTCNAQALSGDYYLRSVPFRYSEEVVAGILSDTLNRTVQVYPHPVPVGNVQTVYSQIPADSLYKRLLQNSDNFIAEQLLLVCSNKLFGMQNTDRMIAHAQERFLKDLPDVPIWKDGSGLSRYNLFTPRTMAKLLEKMYTLVPQERLFNLLPAGGVRGTIENWYVNENAPKQPYIFAKTGTLSNNHCLSGYLVGKSGKVLIFSFMHNNYVVRSDEIKEEMAKILKSLHEAF